MLKMFINILKRKQRLIEKNDINIEELKRLQNMGAIVLDVRSPQEYEEGHIEGAMLIPEYELGKKYNKELKDKNEVIVIYCSSGIRSKKAQKYLEKKGYINVYNLYNGLENY